ncbi:MAG: S9 family peptidase [Deltaproteobacteria bacterium]|nr:S9 family peptidase [Deltaproteobacteria bacterium]
MSSRSLLIGLGLGLLTSCAGRADAPPVSAAADAATQASDPLIPRDVLFGNPDRARPSLSPDGSQISFIAPVDGVLNVWVGPTSDPGKARPVTQDSGRGIRFAQWNPSGDSVGYIQDRGGDENWHFYAVDIATGTSVDLTPIDGVQAQLVGTSDAQPHHALIGLNDRDPRFHDVYRVDLRTGERTLVLKNEEGFAAFIADESLTVRVASRSRPDGGTDYFVRKGKGKARRWEPLVSFDHDDALASTAFGLDRAGAVLYMADSRGRETPALVAYDLASGTSTILAEDPQVGPGAWISDPNTGRPMAVSFDHLRPRWEVLDDAIAPDLEVLSAALSGQFVVTSQTLDGQQWMVTEYRDDGPVHYSHYDRSTREVTPLFTDRAALEGLSLAPMHPVVIDARDGLPLVSYLSLPLGSDPDSDGRPNTPVPMVLKVHGGPWGRDSWGFDPSHQWLTNRGYAVLSVNFRGSTGFTKSFANAGDGEWAAKMHDDLLDAVDWAVSEGIAPRDKVAIMGTSYGGYATLVGLTFTPDVFACGVDIVGPSNLITLLASAPPYWASLRAMLSKRVGNPDTEQGQALLRERSPLGRVDQITKPLLIGQGANDPRVNKAEADQIVDAMTERDIPVTYVLYPDEGHGFARPPNRTSFFAITEAFLSGCLGGTYQPVGDDFEGATLQVPQGAEHVPGLPEALAAHNDGTAK